MDQKTLDIRHWNVKIKQHSQVNYFGWLLDVVCGVFIDLEKAFKHNIFCEKLPYYGFRGKIEVLIKSYLSNRKQLVAINGFESVNLDITCGVQQGSNLGPLLFLLY